MFKYGHILLRRSFALALAAAIAVTAAGCAGKNTASAPSDAPQAATEAAAAPADAAAAHSTSAAAADDASSTAAAAETAETAPLDDGSYSAEGSGFNLTVRMPVMVEVKDGKFTIPADQADAYRLEFLTKVAPKTVKVSTPAAGTLAN